MHSRMRPKYKPTINGKVVDLDLLYQIVTSHGGWEKVNTRNEWDDLLEHFHLPKGTNGGLVIKQIYLKYLENYEKIYFLGEDVGNKEDAEDEYDDVRNRRRTASKMTSRSSYALSQQTPISSSSASNPYQGQGGPSQSVLNPLSDGMREQLGLPKRAGTDYDKLVLSLQCPLPNEQDVALSVCTLLSNETKHVIKLSKCPAVLAHLLAHAGVYQDCGLRSIMEETYVDGREMNVADFWEETVTDPDVKSLLCESYVKRIKGTLGIEDDDSPTGGGEEPELIIPSVEIQSEEDLAIIMNEKFEVPQSAEAAEEDSSAPDTPKPVTAEENKQLPTTTIILTKSDANEIEPTCCDSCPCTKTRSSPLFLPPPSMSRSHGTEDKVGKRIHQIAVILRNLSFEEDNAAEMANSSTLLRYLLLAANCKVGTLPQNAFDTIGNISSHMKLEDPSKDPITSMLLSLLFSGLFSEDRFVILASLEAIRNLTKTEMNEKVLVAYMENKVCKRLCELLTLCDIMLLIYTLECILSITGIGESVCNELVRIKGSVASFVALVTVEAQSYGPKGCILMRVVETVANGSQSTQSNPTGQVGTSSAAPSLTSPPSSTAANSIQAISLRTVSGQTVVPPPAPAAPQSPSTTSQVLSFPNSPSPLLGTVAAISVPGSPRHVRGSSPATSGGSVAFQVLDQSSSSHIAQLHVKSVSLPAPLNNKSPSSPSSSSVVVLHSGAPTSSSSSSGLTQQVSSQSLTQHVFTPSISSENMTEEAWGSAWLRGGFEQLSGTSIEEGELYRMYCVARKKHPASLLSQTQLVQCVKLVYGASVGPVTKNFGSTSLSFIEGLRPKMISFQKSSNSSTVPSSNDATHPPVTTNGISNECALPPVPRPPTPSAAQPPSPLSPILKATLSRPPTPKSPTGVAQRQQKKLQESSNKGENCNSPIRMNGETSSIEKEESSASSSFNSSTEEEPKTEKNLPPPVLSFHGILSNGTGEKGEGIRMDFDEEDLEEQNALKMKGMLVDLLERKVSHKEAAPNGIVGREIRISDRGLEIIENENSGEVDEANNDGEGQEEPQKMTFYASPEVVVPSEQNSVNASSAGVLLSGDGGSVDIPSEGEDEEEEVEGDDGDGASSGDGNFNANFDSNGSTTGNEELLEKFNQFSDLIVVNPEQLGLKRPSNPTGDEPPAKKSSVCVNGIDDPTKTPTKYTVVPTTNNNNQMLNVPIRLINAQNHQQIFTGRPMVLQQGQLVLSTSQGLQGQVIISSKPSGNSSDSGLTKAFILIPQSSTTQSIPASSSNNSASALQAIISQIPNVRDGVPPTALSQIPVELLEQELPFLCEWTGCGYRFPVHSQVFMHAVTAHCPDPNNSEAVRCEWNNAGCDPLLRKRLSIMTHLQDRHCNKQALELACYRRKNKIETPPAPLQPAHHPGYAPNAAFHAIKRHALQYMNPKDIVEENEGPVTKSIRLTSALILRNLANFSPLGRRMITAYESQLSNIAMSNAESSRTISQLLFDMSESQDF